MKRKIVLVADARQRMLEHMNRLWLGGVALLALLALAACGPISASTKIGAAQESIRAAQAKDVQAWKWACYDYYAALMYMKKAREEQGFSDFEAAGNFAAKANKHAQKATKLSRIRRNSNYTLPTCSRQWSMAKSSKYKSFFKKGVRLRDKVGWNNRIEEVQKKQ